MSDFQSIHNLPFEVAPYELQLIDGITYLRFRVGTCEGLWCDGGTFYEILAIDNSEPGNGHLIDTLQWFFQSCVRDKKDFFIRKVWNTRFKNHLMKNYRFEDAGDDDLKLKYKMVKFIFKQMNNAPTNH